MDSIKGLRDYMEDHVYLYQTELEQTIPLDEEGDIRKEYLSYVSLHSIHTLFENVARDISTIIIKPDQENKEFVKTLVESSFYVIPRQTMDEIMDALEVMQIMYGEEDEEDEPDFNASV